MTWHMFVNFFMITHTLLDLMLFYVIFYHVNTHYTNRGRHERLP